jgi:recombination protein RecA
MAAAKKEATSSAHRAKVAINVILKATGQKPLGFEKGGLPFVSSGSFVIDDLIGGTVAPDGKSLICPGYPRRRISEVYGPESSGKTTAALHAIAEVQRQGGVAMFLDFEHALHHGYAQKIGVKFNDTLLYYAPDTLEDGVKMIYVGIKSGLDLIVCDSVAAMVTKDELEKGIDKVARIGERAMAFSRNLPKLTIWLSKDYENNPKGTALIFINQTRASIGGYGDSETTTGGMALKFFAYLRLRFVRLRSDVIKRKDKVSGKDRSYPYGNHTQVKVVKSKVDAKQGHTGDIFIRFGFGIDDIHSIIEGGVSNKIIKKSGPMYEYAGQKFKGKERLRAFLVGDPKVTMDLRKTVLEAIRAMDTIPDEDLAEDDEIAMGIEMESGSDDTVNEEVLDEAVEEESASIGDGG